MPIDAWQMQGLIHDSHPPILNRRRGITGHVSGDWKVNDKSERGQAWSPTCALTPRAVFEGRLRIISKGEA